MSAFVIERAGPADSEDVARCHSACWLEAYTGIVSASYLARMADLPARIARWHPRLTDSGCLTSDIPSSDGSDSGCPVYVARVEDDGAVIGEIWVGRDDEPRRRDLPLTELRSLYVRSAWHGTGVADELVRVALGDEAAWLWVFTANARARRLYARHRFAPTGERQTDTGTGVPEIRMARPPARA